ncbi:hypothetical protein D1220_25105 [Klebsiella pneumoniae]|nr:hypothetical protein D1220_25105 [Klebsiella pneumoniae]
MFSPTNLQPNGHHTRRRKKPVSESVKKSFLRTVTFFLQECRESRFVLRHFVVLRGKSFDITGKRRN